MVNQSRTEFSAVDDREHDAATEAENEIVLDKSDAVQNGLEISDDDEADDTDDIEDGIEIGEDANQDSTTENSFQAFSSEEEEGDSGGVPAG